jgi:hypothetical protein
VSGIGATLLHALTSASVLLLVIGLVAPPRASAFLSDTANHPPPSTGGQAYYNTYGSFGPNQAGFPGKGQSYVDPVFGTTITRLTNELGQQSWSDIYAKNGYTNADNTLTVHNTPGGRSFINPTTGAVVRASVPGNDNSSFAPDNPDTWWWYTYGGTTLSKYSVATGTSTVVKNFGAPINNNGGSTDWIDASGRYMLLRLGNTWRVYDVQADVLYSGAISDSYGGTSGWGGISPDGNWVVTTNSGPAMHRSWAINHTTKTLSTTGNVFWTLCGDHADLVSASNGKTYFVTFECDSVAGIYAVDISIPQSPTNKPKQLADNRMLFKTSWSDSGHFSGVSKGLLRDWAFISVESGDDTFGSTLGSWRPFMQEIVMANVVTGELRRIAHHRSRSPQANYYYTPRVSASWDGSVVTWASNMGYSGSGYADIYSARIDTGSGGSTGGGSTPPPSTLTASFTNPAANATVSGTVTVSVGATGGSGSGYTFTVKAGTTTIYSGTNGSFSWNTTTVANGSVTLTVTATDGAGATGSVTRTVNVSNVVAGALTVSFISPAAGATVSGVTTVAVGATGGSGSGYTYTVKIGTTTLYSGTAASFNWTTTGVPNGSATLSATVTNGAATASVTRTVTVSNTTSGTGTGATQNVVWTSAVKVAVTGNTITKNAGCNGCWDAGAISQQLIVTGDGSVQFAVSAGMGGTVGLSNGNTGTSGNEVKFGLRFYPGSPGIVEVRELGAYKWDFYHVAGAVYRVAVEAGKVKYYQNGTLKYTSATAPSYPLLLDTALDNVGNAVQNATITTGSTTSGGTTTPATTTGPQNVVWTSAVKVTVSGNSFTKNNGCNGCWDAGAVSQQTIASGNGSVEFKTSANAYLAVGLSTGNSGTSVNEIKFALRFTPGSVSVQESGVYKAEWLSVAGAVYKVAVESGKVKYYANGILKYTSTLAPTYPLLVDTTVGTVAAGVQGAVITK